MVIFAHSIDDPSSVSRLAQRAVPSVKGTDGFKGATLVMLGVGNEMRRNTKYIEELARNRIHMASVEQCRSIARHCRLNGFIECASDPKSLREAVLRAAGIHLSVMLKSKGLADARRLSPFALDSADSAMLPHPLEDDEELGEIKVLILGHQAGGKVRSKEHRNEKTSHSHEHFQTTLLRRMEEDEKRKQNLLRLITGLEEMPQPKSTIGIKFKEFREFAKGLTLRVLDFAGSNEFPSFSSILSLT